ncbi:MAG: energy-coupling factor transporter transmembrane protein EcfT [Spirochaetaceae bacterium]|jgi:energy-coupling factor transporter transmembrane protein EcfT|nr:energy-coupling factor transporter transmembrane protein EcfT [Spirochaetaceae bacterium]
MAVGLQYKINARFLRSIPCFIKLIFLFASAVIFFKLSLTIIAALIIFFMALAFFCGWTPAEFFADIKAALYYAFILYAAQLILNLNFIPERSFFLYTARLFLIMQCAALVFRTTSSIEIKETLSRLDPSGYVSVNLALTISFIPELFSLWEAICRAWKSRGCKKNIFAAKHLLFAFISISFYRASIKGRAMAARGLLPGQGKNGGSPAKLRQP